MWKSGHKKEPSYTPHQKLESARLRADRERAERLRKYDEDRAEFERERDQERLMEERIAAQKASQREDRSRQERINALSSTTKALKAQIEATNKIPEYDALPLEYEKTVEQLKGIISEIKRTPPEDVKTLERLHLDMVKKRETVSEITEKMSVATQKLRESVKLTEESKTATKRAEIAKNLTEGGRKRKRKTRRAKR